MINRSNPKFAANWVAVLLLLIWFFTRIHNLLALPVFLDEASHITRAQWVWQGKPLYLLETGKALAPYITALFWPFQGQIFIGRFVVILLVLVGLAACYGVGKSLYSRQAGLFAMLLWTVSTQLFFFERMALVDTTMAAMAMLTLWLAIRMVQSGKMKIAVWCGLALTATILAKLTGIVFVPLPLMVLFFIKCSLSWKTRLKLAIIAYVVAFSILLPIGLYIKTTGEDPTGVKYGLTSTNTATLAKRLQTNWDKVLDAERTYFTVPALYVLITGLVAAAILVPPSAILLLLLALAPLLAVIAAAASLWLRYATPPIPFFLLLASIGFIAAMDQLRKAQLPRIVAIIPYVFAAVWVFNLYLPFQSLAYTNPAELPLPQGDRSEYIEWIPSGFGIQDAVTYLQKTIDQPTSIIVTAANCDGARMYVPFNSPLTLICPGIDWAGGNVRIIDDMRARVARDGQLYVLGEEYPIVREYELPQPFTIIARFPRPHPADYYAVKLYLLERADAAQPMP